MKIEDIEEMMKYNILITPVLMIDDQVKVRGRVAAIASCGEGEGQIAKDKLRKTNEW